MKRLNLIITIAFSIFALSAFAQPGDIPFETEPGKCYAKCLIPDQYETVTEQIMVKSASKRTSTTPATYETVTDQVLVKAESKKVIAVPAVYETVTEQMMVKPETKRLIPVPAVYETVTETITSKAESKRLVPVAAQYETVTEQYVAKEASSRIETVPAKYETVTERIEVSPASTKWVKKKADRNCLSADPNDCLVWCLVEVPASYKTVSKRQRIGCPDGYTDNGDDCTREIAIPAEYASRSSRVIKTPATYTEQAIPAEYKTVSKRVLKSPATFTEEIIPAEYKTVSKKVVKTPATFTEQSIPAEYKTVSRRVLKTAASVTAIEVPAEYTTISKTVLVKPGGFSEWREVLCSSDVTTSRITQIQRALIAKGYDVGPAGVDNIFGTDTKAALVKFQKDNGLPVGQLDFETLKALGVN